MEHFIIGTAGHIDHGKTSLIKALTNIDCDTHPEEKKRGITINLGFAYLKKEDGDYLAFVDVPGHHRFIANMVAGATGIDFVMLVVAADDGVMPQTREHLKICSLLGIKNGVVVISKCDAVESDYLELCREEIEGFVNGTFLENKPIFEVSSLTGIGIDSLRDYLIEGDYLLAKKVKKDFFRMSVDRIFNVSGFGAVATGTVAHGEVSVGDNVLILPSEIEAKVRGIQRHTQQIESADVGTRVAIDLAGVKRESIDFGDILCSVAPPETVCVDVKLVMMDGHDTGVRKFDAIMLCGTRKLSVKVKIIDYFIQQNNLCATAQIDMLQRWYMSVGDYFIIRNSSYDSTVAGGYVVDPYPLIHKNITAELQVKLKAMCDNTIGYLVCKVEESIIPLSVDFFVPILQLRREKIIEMVSSSEHICIVGGAVLMSTDKLKEFSRLVTDNFSKFTKRNPLSAIGVSRKKLLELVSDFRFSKIAETHDNYVSLALDYLESRGEIVRKENQWSLPGARTEISEKESSDIRKIEAIIENYGYAPIDMDDLFREAKSAQVDDLNCRYIVTYLSDLKLIIRINEMIFGNKKLCEARRMLVDYLKAHSEEGIKAAQYRDLIGANRKIAVILLEIFDKERIVYRKDDVRYLV